MPLQLNYTDSNTGLNLPTSYWFVQYANIDNVNNIITVTIGGYVNIAAKQAGHTQFLTKVMTLPFATLGLTAASTIAQLLTAIYTAALTYTETFIVFFNGATIV